VISGPLPKQHCAALGAANSETLEGDHSRFGELRLALTYSASDGAVLILY
jgi:hypothetical protein